MRYEDSWNGHFENTKTIEKIKVNSVFDKTNNYNTEFLKWMSCNSIAAVPLIVFLLPCQVLLLLLWKSTGKMITNRFVKLLIF